MQTKILSWGASIATLIVLSLAGTANAIVFNRDDQLNEFGSIQFANNFKDVLFIPRIGGSGFSDPAPPGSLAREFLSVGGNTGAFAAYNNNFFPTLATIRSFSFDPQTDVNGFIPGANGNTFIELPPSSTLTEGALLTLDLDNAQLIGSPGSGLPITIPGLEFGEIIFRATGRIKDVASGEIAKIAYDFAVGGLIVNPSDPTQTSIGGFSGTKIIIGTVPEPPNHISLIVLDGFIAAGTIKKKILS